MTTSWRGEVGAARSFSLAGGLAPFGVICRISIGKGQHIMHHDMTVLIWIDRFMGYTNFSSGMTSLTPGRVARGLMFVQFIPRPTQGSNER